MAARVMGGSEVRLIDLSRRGLLVETESRLAIGAKTTIRIATMEGIVYVRGLVVRSRVAGLGQTVVFHTALALEEDLALANLLAQEQAAREEILAAVDLPVPISTSDAETYMPELRADATGTPSLGEPESLSLTVTVPQVLQEIQHRAAERGNEI